LGKNNNTFPSQYTQAGSRQFCGIIIPDGLVKDQKLPELLVTPSTKGVLVGIPGVPEQDDVNVSRADIDGSFAKFGFKSVRCADIVGSFAKFGFKSVRCADVDGSFAKFGFKSVRCADVAGSFAKFGFKTVRCADVAGSFAKLGSNRYVVRM
jgi:phosphoribosylaminoimidazole-succinocarboxamide synthase